MLNQMLNRQENLWLSGGITSCSKLSRLESSGSFSPQLASIRKPYSPWFAGAASSRWGGVKYNGWLDSWHLGFGERFNFSMMDGGDGQRKSETRDLSQIELEKLLPSWQIDVELLCIDFKGKTETATPSGQQFFFFVSNQTEIRISIKNAKRD